jgi:hypothetical protein
MPTYKIGDNRYVMGTVLQRKGIDTGTMAEWDIEGYF